MTIIEIRTALRKRARQVKNSDLKKLLGHINKVVRTMEVNGMELEDNPFAGIQPEDVFGLRDLRNELLRNSRRFLKGTAMEEKKIVKHMALAIQQMDKMLEAEEDQ